MKQISHWHADPCNEVEKIQARMDGRGLEPHFHDSWSFGIVVKGNCTFKSRGEMQLAPVGAVFAIPPFEVHESLPTAEAVEYRVVYVAAHVLEAHAPELPGLIHSGRKRVWVDGERAFAIGSDARALMSPDVSLGEWLRAFAARLRTASPGVARPPSNVLRQSLDQQWSEPLVLAEIESATQHTRWHAIRTFRQQVGLTPGAYLRQLRAIKSRHLLRSGLTIAQTAHALHFSDQPHYTRTFKQVFGVTPGRFQSLSRHAPSAERFSKEHANDGDQQQDSHADVEMMNRLG